MATLRNEQKLAAVQPLQEKHKSNMLGKASHETRPFLELMRIISHRFPRRLKAGSLKKLSQDFSRTASRILGAQSKLDVFLLNPQIRTQFGTVPGTFRNTNVENQEPNDDRSQDDAHPEVGPSVCQSRHPIDLDADEAPHRFFLCLFKIATTVS